MGRKPVQILAGLAMVGATLVGCESSRPHQSSQPLRGGVTATAPSTGSGQPGWNQPSGVAGRTTPGNGQQMPLGQPGVAVPSRPTQPGSTAGGMPSQPLPIANDRQPAWNNTAAPIATDRATPRGVTTSAPVTNSTPIINAAPVRSNLPEAPPRIDSRVTSPSIELPSSPPLPTPGGVAAPESSTSRRMQDVIAPLPAPVSPPLPSQGAPVIDPPLPPR